MPSCGRGQEDDQGSGVVVQAREQGKSRGSASLNTAVQVLYRSLMADRIRKMLETPRGVGRQGGENERQAVQLV